MRQLPGLALVSCLLALGACKEDRSGVAPPPVIHPELAGLAASAQSALEAQRVALDEAVAAHKPPEELAEVFGATGRMYHAYDLHQAAAACYVHARFYAPDDARWPYYLGVIHVFDGRFDDAVQLFSEALEIDGELEVARLRLADALLELGQVERAARLFDEASGGAWAAFGSGRAALLSGDHEAAARHFEEALDLEPTATAVHHPLATAYRQLGRTELVEEHVMRAGTVPVSRPDPLMAAVANSTSDAMSRLGRGGMAAAHGRHREALPIYREAVSAEPANTAARLALGTTLAHLGEDEEAEAELREATRLSPEDSQTHFHLASHLFRSSSDTAGLLDAAEHFERAAALDPLDVEATLGLAQALERLSHFAESLKAFERAISLDPQSRPALLGRASCLLALSRNHEARRALERLVEEDPLGVMARINLAVLDSREGRVQEAVEQFETVLRLGGDDALLAVVHFNLAVLLRESASQQTIRSHYEKAVQLDPTHVNAHANLGNLLMQERDPAGAVVHYRRALELAPALVEVRILEAQALTLLGRTGEAVTVLQEGLEGQPESEALRRALAALTSRD